MGGGRGVWMAGLLFAFDFCFCLVLCCCFFFLLDLQFPCADCFSVWLPPLSFFLPSLFSLSFSHPSPLSPLLSSPFPSPPAISTLPVSLSSFPFSSLLTLPPSRTHQVPFFPGTFFFFFFSLFLFRLFTFPAHQRDSLSPLMAVERVHNKIP